MTSRALLQASAAVKAALVLAAVLTVDPWGWDQVGPLRWALVATLGVAAVALTVAVAAVTGVPLSRPAVRGRPMLRALAAGWGLLGVGLVLGTLVSNEPWIAVFGTPDRHLGLLTWVLFALLFVAGLNASRLDRRLLAWAATAGAGVSGVWALIEALTDATLADGFGGRTGAAFGQPAYLGAAMVLCVPLAGWLALSAVEPPWARGLAFVAMLSGMFALSASGTRAAWVGALAAAVAVLAVNGRGGAGRFRNTFGSQGLYTLAALGLATIIMIALTPIGGRLVDLTNLSGGVVAGRIDEWQVGLRALVGTRGGITGLGPEGYRTVFGAFVDEQYVIDHGRFAITDRAHNVYLDGALAGGWWAAAGLLALHGALAVAAVGRLRKPSGLVDVALAVAVIAFIVQQWFLFPLAEVDPVFWLVAGMLVGRSAPPRLDTESGQTRPLHVGAAVVLGMAALAVAAFGALNVAADHRVAAAVAATDQSVAEDQALSAVDLRPRSTRYRFIAARILARTDSGLDSAIAELEAGLDLAPSDPALNVERADLLLNRARVSGDPGRLQQALDALADIDAADPNNPRVQQLYGIALGLSERYDEAENRLVHAARLAPTDPSMWLNLAVLHSESGRTDDAAAALDQAARLAPDDPRIADLRADLDTNSTNSTDEPSTDSTDEPSTDSTSEPNTDSEAGTEPETGDG